MIKISFLTIQDDLWTAEDDYLLLCISPEKAEQLRRLHFTIDRKLKLYSGLLLRMQFSEACGCPPSTLRFQQREKGKPYCVFPPYAPEFNLSHTRNAIVLVLGKEPLGIDLESINLPFPDYVYRDFVNHSNMFFTDLSNSSKVEQTERIRNWTHFEAYAKYCGDGFTVHKRPLTPIIPTILTYYFGDYIVSVCTGERVACETTLLTDSELRTFCLCQ